MRPAATAHGLSPCQFLTVPYFIQLPLARCSAQSSFRRSPCMRRRELRTVDPTLAWTRAGIVGMWSVCTSAAGIINFEYVGPSYRVRGSISPVWVLAAIVSSNPLWASISFACRTIWALAELNLQVMVTFQHSWPRHVLGVPLLKRRMKT